MAHDSFSRTIFTILNYINSVLEFQKMSLDLFSLPQRQHKMQIIRKFKSANSVLMFIIYIYIPSNEQLFYLVFFYIIYIRSHQESKVWNLFWYVFTMSLNYRTVSTWFNYILQTVLVYLPYCYDANDENNLQKRYRMPFK